jgi:hypothetical protein
MKPFFFLPLFSLLVGVTACGSTSNDGASTDSNGTTPAACEAAGTHICQRACACATDGKCYVATRTDAGATASLAFDNEEKCRNLYVTFGCFNGGNTALDYGVCDSSVAAAACVGGSSSSGPGVLLPDSCKSTN